MANKKMRLLLYFFPRKSSKTFFILPTACRPMKNFYASLLTYRKKKNHTGSFCIGEKSIDAFKYVVAKPNAHESKRK